MTIVVNDANILIDLVKLELLQSFFNLSFEFYTTDLVLGDLCTKRRFFLLDLDTFAL